MEGLWAFLDADMKEYKSIGVLTEMLNRVKFT